MRKLRQQKKQQGTVEQWLLVIVMLLLFFWKKIEPKLKEFMCECSHDNTNEEKVDNTIDLPDDDFKMTTDILEFNKEEFERANDENVLNIDASTLTKEFNADKDILKITRNEFSS